MKVDNKNTSYLVRIKQQSNNNLAEIYVYNYNEFGIKFAISTISGKATWFTNEYFYDTYEVLQELEFDYEMLNKLL